MKKFLPIFLLAVFFLSQKVTEAKAAATLSLSPATGNFPLSGNFNVEVRFDTGTDTAKTVKALLTFPATLLTVEEITTTGSVVTSWNQRLYSNSNGTVSLNGDVGVSGVSGAGKSLATIKLKVKANGTAALKFTAGSQILKLSDGTDILSLTSSTNGSYLLGSQATQPTATPSGGTVPITGDYSGTTGVILVSLFFIILGIMMGRSTSRSF